MRWLSMNYRFDPETSVIDLYVTIEGVKEKRKIKMALDTGASYTMIPWEVVEVLGYETQLSKNSTSLITASGVEKAPVIKVKSMEVLEKQGKEVPTVVHDLPERSYVDGLLGLSFLRNFEVRLDFKKGILEID